MKYMYTHTNYPFNNFVSKSFRERERFFVYLFFKIIIIINNFFFNEGIKRVKVLTMGRLWRGGAKISTPLCMFHDTCWTAFENNLLRALWLLVLFARGVFDLEWAGAATSTTLCRLSQVPSPPRSPPHWHPVPSFQVRLNRNLQEEEGGLPLGREKIGESQCKTFFNHFYTNY